jgi:group II intron reverse transcriptase/maturase
MSLVTPPEWIQKLQQSLQAKAKSEPSYRFYALWDKVWRDDVLMHAYRCCRANEGAAGMDGVTFVDIEAQGVVPWLRNLQKELREDSYNPSPLLRVWIPKSNGGQRPLGIATIRDRVAQQAMLLVLGPIFEPDLLPQQYGFRKGLDAKMAVRRVFFHITQHGRREVVDGDLSDYFTTIPHGALMKCVARRVVDRRVLQVIKQWLTAPVVEREGRRLRRTTEARDSKRGTPQGAVVSPLLANLYFRRFVLAWHLFGYDRSLDAHIVNYADDFVICCWPGRGSKAKAAAEALFQRIGLTVNEKKTRLALLPGDSFDFLGYTFGRRYGKDGRAYIGTRPSKKAVRRVRKRIREETSRRWLTTSAEKRVSEVNYVLRGWCGYFNQGPVRKEYDQLRSYTERRLRRWLMRKHKRRGTGYRQYPDEYLYGTLGLFKPQVLRTDPSSAKA